MSFLRFYGGITVNNSILDALESCGVCRSSVHVRDIDYIFSINGVVVCLCANMGYDGYGLFSGEMYRGSLSSADVRIMHDEWKRIMDPVSGRAVDNDCWLEFVRAYNYRRFFEFGIPEQIIPGLVRLANMSLDEYIEEEKDMALSFSVSEANRMGGCLGKLLGLFN